jgi:Flp pilus assembly protein TadB
MSDPHPPQPSFAEIVGEVANLIAGLTVALLPLWIICLPGVFLILVVPVILLAIVAAVPALVVGAVVAPPVLIVRALRRRRLSA